MLGISRPSVKQLPVIKSAVWFTLYKDPLSKLLSRTFRYQQPVFVVIWSNYSEDSWRFLESIRRFQTWPEAFRPFPKMTRLFSKITEPMFTVYYETGFQKRVNLRLLLFDAEYPQLVNLPPSSSASNTLVLGALTQTFLSHHWMDIFLEISESLDRFCVRWCQDQEAL